jgi:hypothetical protein
MSEHHTSYRPCHERSTRDEVDAFEVVIIVVVTICLGQPDERHPGDLVCRQYSTNRYSTEWKCCIVNVSAPAIDHSTGRYETVQNSMSRGHSAGKTGSIVRVQHRYRLPINVSTDDEGPDMISN